MAATPLPRPTALRNRSARKIGLISFLVSADRSGIDELATQRFTDELLHAQPGLELIELGPIAKLLGKLGRRRLDEETTAVIGRQYALDAIILGQLSCNHPHRQPSALQHGSRLNTVAVALSVRLLDATTGRVRWSRTLRREESVRPSDVAFGAYRRPLDDAGDALIGELLHEICVELCPRANAFSN